MVNLSFKLEEKQRNDLKALCAVKSEKQQDIIYKIVNQWIEANKFILNEADNEEQEIILTNKVKKKKLP